MKTPMPEMKNIAYIISGGLDIVEEMISKLEDVALEMIWIETQKNINLKINRVSMSFGKTPSGLICLTGNRKHTGRNNGQIFSTYDEKYKLTSKKLKESPAWEIWKKKTTKHI